MVSKAHGTRVLLDGVSLGIGVGERIGVVGRNGDGKTTLLEVMAQREPVDAGRVTHAGGLRLGRLSQHDDLDPAQTVREAVLGEREAHDWAGNARARDVLTGLFGGLDLPGFPAGLDTLIEPLSGGERRRVALARMLVADHDLLMLDEPTNHLDVEGIDWLAGHLLSRRESVLVVTHDRWFLDAVCDRTWEVQGGAVNPYDGGYSAYVLAKAERARIAGSEEARRANLMRKELAWLRRGPPARTSKPRFRIDAANALIADEPPPRDGVDLVRFASKRLGRTVYELDDVTLRIGSRTLLADVTWNVGPGDRIGVVGVNGSGKTTLLRLLAGETQPAEGTLVTGVTVRLGYLSQEVRELPESLRVLEAVQDVRRVVDLGKGRTMTASQLCERFGFGADKQWTPVADLSGGERRRLQLLRLLMDEPNVLMLDEPTNDLDIETLTALEDLLDGWAGTLLVVSHDRYFIERACDTVVALLGDGDLRDLPRGVEEYLERRRAGLRDSGGADAARGEGVARVDASRAADGPGSAGSGVGAKPPAGPNFSPAQVRATRKELTRIERQVKRLAEREERLHADLATHATDHQRVVSLDAELQTTRRERSALEDQWLALVDAVD